MAVLLPFFPFHHPHPVFCHHDFSHSLKNPNFQPLHKHSVLAVLAYAQKTNICTQANVSLLEVITELCESKTLIKALNLLQENQEKTFLDPTQKGLALGILLQACGVQKDIETGRKVHRLIWTSTYLRNDPVLNTRLITMYSMCGSPLDSRSVFDRLPGRNLYQWNALLKGYARNEFYYEALCLFGELISVPMYRPNNFTFPCVIKSCREILDVGLGSAVHGMAVKIGLDCDDVYVGNALIAMYGKFGFLEDAIRAFEHMPERNIVSWNSMISVSSENWCFKESFDFFIELLFAEEKLVPDSATMVIILPVCAAEGDFMKGKVVHGLAVKLGISGDLMVSNALIEMYSKCGFLDEAKTLFDMNDSKNLVSWNSMIGGYSREGYVDGTFDLLRKMYTESNILKADEVTLLNTLSVCLKPSELLSLKELHGYSIKNGFEEDEMLVNAFIASYARCGLLRTARTLFDRLLSKTVSTYNAFMAGCLQNGDSSKALDIYLRMTHSGIQPDSITIANILSACRHLKLLPPGKQVHGFVLRNGLEIDHFIITSLLSLYFSCKDPGYAQLLFDNIENKGLVSWNAMVSGYLQNCLPGAALNIFHQMLSDGIQPNNISIVSVFGAISQFSALKLGKEAHCFALKVHLLTDNLVYCSLIDMYAKSGSIESSQKVFDQLQNKDTATCSAMISGFAIHGLGKLADILFLRMNKLGLKPDHFTFMGIINACNHAGMIEHGLKYFTEMQTLYSVEPKLEHYACVVDMLARAGRFADALELASIMPFQPDARIWSSLLSASKIYNEFDLGKKFAQKLLELAPDKAECYVLVSNFYAGSGKWDDVRRIRGKMKEMGLQKDAGCSWTEVGGKSCSFIVGNKMLPVSQEIRGIYKELE